MALLHVLYCFVYCLRRRNDLIVVWNMVLFASSSFVALIIGFSSLPSLPSPLRRRIYIPYLASSIPFPLAPMWKSFIWSHNNFPTGSGVIWFHDLVSSCCCVWLMCRRCGERVYRINFSCPFTVVTHVVWWFLSAFPPAKSFIIRFLWPHFFYSHSQR